MSPLCFPALPACALIAFSCVVRAQESAINPLGAFSFDFGRLGNTPGRQIDALKAIGYSGATLDFNGSNPIRKITEFGKAAKERGFAIHAAHWVLKITPGDNANNLKFADSALDAMREAGAGLWLILGTTDAGRDKQLEVIAAIADKAKAKGVPFILYPHDNQQIESAEDALTYIRDLKRDDVFVSFHLCHEIRAGNGDRLDEVAANIKPYLRLATINGADNAYDGDNEDWSRTIQPLYMGDFAPGKMLHALRSIGYTGPVMLHTFGLQKSEADHHAKSYRRYVELFREASGP